MRYSSRFMPLIVLTACLSITAFADVKIKSRQSVQGQTQENTIYIKGKRQRTEAMNGQIVTIQQCDLRRDLQLMPPARVYTVTPYEESTGTRVNTASQTPATTTTPSATQGGLVTTTITTKDTGERKQMFGYPARHIISTIETVSSPDACTPVKSKMVQDGWYIDATFQLTCDTDQRGKYYRSLAKAGCQDKHQTKQIGTAKIGYPVWVKMTIFGDNGTESFSMINEVIELSPATLDAALFELPAGYREVPDFAGVSMANQTSLSSSEQPASNDSGMNANVKNLAQGTAATATPLGEKKAGVVRLGLAAVKTGTVGEGLNATELAAAVAHTLTEYLKAPNIELVPLEARLPALMVAEARQKECDFVISTLVTHKKGGGGGFGGMLGKVAPALGSVAPVAGMGSTAGAVAGQVASTVIYTAAGLSANVKSKDEMTLELSLQAPGNAAAPAVNKQFKTKAKANGEDIISPLIEQAAQSIIDASSSR